MEFILMNKDNQYTKSNIEVVMTHVAYMLLSKEKNSPIQKEIDFILPEIQQLSVFVEQLPIQSSLELRLAGRQPGGYCCGNYNFYGFVKIENKGSSDPEDKINILQYNPNDIFGTNYFYNLTQNENFINAYNKVKKYYDFKGIEDFRQSIDSVKQSIKLISDIRILDEQEIIIGTENSVVIFSPSQKGFLNKKGEFTSLSSALIFRNAELAKRSVSKSKSRYVAKDLIFVDVNIQIKKISDQQLYPVGDIGYLGTLIAKNEQDQIEQSFELIEKQKQKRL